VINSEKSEITVKEFFMKNKFLVVAIISVILAVGLVFLGCPALTCPGGSEAAPRNADAGACKISWGGGTSIPSYSVCDDYIKSEEDTGGCMWDQYVEYSTAGDYTKGYNFECDC
jgi:hypothetical protein